MPLDPPAGWLKRVMLSVEGRMEIYQLARYGTPVQLKAALKAAQAKGFVVRPHEETL